MTGPENEPTITIVATTRRVPESGRAVLASRRAARAADVLPPGRVGYDLGAPELLLHTRVPHAAVAELERTGALRGRADLVEEEFRTAYDWVAQQVRDRVAGAAGGYPIWAWARTTRANIVAVCRLAPGETLLTLSVPRDRVLLSEHGSWHCVLNDWPVDDGEEEWAATEQRWRQEHGDRFDEVRSTYVQGTWDRIFDVHAFPRRSHIQACLEAVLVSDVVTAVDIRPTHTGRRSQSSSMSR